MTELSKNDGRPGLEKKVRQIIKEQIKKITKRKKIEKGKNVKKEEQGRGKEKVEGKAEEKEEVQEDMEEPDSFAKVRETIKPKNLRILALNLRRQWEGLPNRPYAKSKVDCQIKPESLTGSFHILYQIEFSDNVRWLLKVPANGYKDGFDKLSASSLRAEALTMRLIKRKTTIPIPEVYGFDDTCDNLISCAFIMMEHITGQPLQDVWFNQNDAPELVEQHRSRALQDIAKSMIQLNEFTFFRGGTILFEEDGSPSGNTESFKMMDTRAMFDHAQDEEASGNGNIYCEVQPIPDARGYLTCMLHKRALPMDQFDHGFEKLLHVFIDFATLENQSLLKEYMAGEKDQNQFVLTHPDFDIQNFIVSKDGSLRGVIDWDGAIATPRGIAGNESYPGWLTRDWDAMFYSYDPESPNRFENSPSELRFYRSMYQRIIRDVTGSDLAALMTARTLVFDNLAIAARNPLPTAHIIDKIFQEISVKVSKELEEVGRDESTEEEESSGAGEDEETDATDEKDSSVLDFYSVCMDLGEGMLSDTKHELLAQGFRALFHEQ